jgi:hypothetical protein
LNINQILDPIRPIAQLVGKIVLVCGVLKFFGINIPINGSGLELAAIGWLMASI